MRDAHACPFHRTLAETFVGGGSAKNASLMRARAARRSRDFRLDFRPESASFEILITNTCPTCNAWAFAEGLRAGPTSGFQRVRVAHAADAWRVRYDSYNASGGASQMETRFAVVTEFPSRWPIVRTARLHYSSRLISGRQPLPLACVFFSSRHRRTRALVNERADGDLRSFVVPPSLGWEVYGKFKVNGRPTLDRGVSALGNAGNVGAQIKSSSKWSGCSTRWIQQEGRSCSSCENNATSWKVRLVIGWIHYETRS